MLENYKTKEVLIITCSLSKVMLCEGNNYLYYTAPHRNRDIPLFLIYMDLEVFAAVNQMRRQLLQEHICSRCLNKT